MKNLLLSFVYALKGILAGFSSERNLKVQIFVALITVGASLYFGISPIEWYIILFCIGLVIGAELLNTAIEKLVDLVTQERKPLAGKIKDMAAGAVLVVSIISVVIGVIIFRKYLLL